MNWTGGEVVGEVLGVPVYEGCVKCGGKVRYDSEFPALVCMICGKAHYLDRPLEPPQPTGPFAEDRYIPPADQYRWKRK